MSGKKKHREVASEQLAVGFQIAPMIDVVFVIMLFFMVMTGSVKVERELVTKLPGPDNSTQLVKFPPEEITLGILEDGTVTLNDEPFDPPTNKSLPMLTRTLRRVVASSARQQQQVLVTLQAEEQASYERIVDVLNSLQQAQIQNVTFTVGNAPP